MSTPTVVSFSFFYKRFKVKSEQIDTVTISHKNWMIGLNGQILGFLESAFGGV